MLMKNNTLQSLSVISCPILDKGIAHLSSASLSLCDLYLSENKRITGAEVVALSEMLKKNKTLKKLTLHRFECQ